MLEYYRICRTIRARFCHIKSAGEWNTVIELNENSVSENYISSAVSGGGGNQLSA